MDKPMNKPMNEPMLAPSILTCRERCVTRVAGKRCVTSVA